MERTSGPLPPAVTPGRLHREAGADAPNRSPSTLRAARQLGGGDARPQLWHAAGPPVKPQRIHLIPRDAGWVSNSATVAATRSTSVRVAAEKGLGGDVMDSPGPPADPDAAGWWWRWTGRSSPAPPASASQWPSRWPISRARRSSLAAGSGVPVDLLEIGKGLAGVGKVDGVPGGQLEEQPGRHLGAALHQAPVAQQRHHAFQRQGPIEVRAATLQAGVANRSSGDPRGGPARATGAPARNLPCRRRCRRSAPAPPWSAPAS